MRDFIPQMKCGRVPFKAGVACGFIILSTEEWKLLAECEGICALPFFRFGKEEINEMG